MPARRRPSVVPPAKAKKSAEPKSGNKAEEKKPAPAVSAEELALLGDRDDVGRVSAQRIRRTVDEMLERQRTRDASAGLNAHDDGSTIIRLYRWRAEEEYGHPQFRAFVLRVLGIKQSTMYRYLLVTKYATREQAKWGIGTVVAIGRLIEKVARSVHLQKRLGLSEPPAVIDDLKTVRFTLPDGRELDFGGKVTRENAEELLLALQPGRPRRRLTSDFAEQNSAVKGAIRANPKLRGTTARHRIKRGKHLFELSVPDGVDLEAALRAVLEALGKS